MDNDQPGAGTPQYPRRSFVSRWKHEDLFDKGFLAIPVVFLHHYAKLEPPLSTGEVLFILHLMSFKWDSGAPFPAYRTLAERMGVTPKMVRRHAKSLEEKGYLDRDVRPGQTNRFYLEPLFDALSKSVKATPPDD